MQSNNYCDYCKHCGSVGNEWRNFCKHCRGYYDDEVEMNFDGLELIPPKVVEQLTWEVEMLEKQLESREVIPIEDVEKLLRSQPFVKVEPYQWIPVKWRELTEEENEHEYGEVPVAMADFLTPDDGDEILITRGGRVEITVYDTSDGYIGDEDWNDWLTEVDAWMPMPKPYKKGR